MHFKSGRSKARLNQERETAGSCYTAIDPRSSYHVAWLAVGALPQAARPDPDQAVDQHPRYSLRTRSGAFGRAENDRSAKSATSFAPAANVVPMMAFLPLGT